jgi:formate hydrogenlyase subunit 3/multisubunit Na+/H+ antiporter MnhD subunit
MKFFLFGLICILSGGVFSLIFAEKFKAKILSLFTFAGAALVAIPALKTLSGNSSLSYTVHIPGFIGDVNFVIDPLSAFFLLVITVMSFIGTLYAVGYIKPYVDKNYHISSHFLFLSILITSMLLVVTIQSHIAFLIAWEIMSLSSFFLVIFESNKKEVISAGLNYLVTMHVSFLFLLFGFIALSAKGAMSDIIFLLLFIGFGIKAGFIPFHNWLPKAHPAAPSHISGIMSGVMIKTGIYGILRALTLVGIPSLKISYFVLFISVISALFGVLYAIAQHDLKRLLAYHSIENIGIIGIGIGIGMLGLAYNNDVVAIIGFSGGTLHILNHAIFKQLLFFAAGAVYTKAHTKNIEKLGGLIKPMPFTAGLFLVASIAITGLPPLNGFISEFLIYLGLLNGLSINSSTALMVFALSIAGLAMVGTMALLCFTKAFSIVFLGAPRHEKSAAVKEEVPATMLVPMAFLAFLTFVIGLFPQYAVKLVINPALMYVHNTELSLPVSLLRTLSFGGFGFILLFGAIFGLRALLLRNKSVYRYKTWDCGYQQITARMQYTATSFASPFLGFMSPFFIINPEGKRHYGHDILEFYLINPILKFNKNVLQRFYWIQSGNTQQYILYGLVFLIITLVFTVGVK